MSNHVLEIPNPPLEALPRFRPYNNRAFNQGSYLSGKQWSVQLDKQDHLLRGTLYLTGVLAGQGSGSAAARIRNPVRLLSPTRMQVYVNGKPEMEARPDMLFFRAQWRRGQDPLQATRLTTAQANTAANATFALQLPLDFVPPQWIPGHYGVLLADKAGDIYVTGQWGTLGDLLTSAGTQSISSANLSLQLDRTRMTLTPSQLLRGFGHAKLWSMEQSVPATTTQHFEIPGGKTIAALYILAEAGSTPEPSDSVLTSTGNIKVARGTDVFYNGPIADLLQYTQNGLPSAYDRTGLYAVDFMRPMLREQAIISKSIICPGSVPLSVDIDVTTSTGSNLVFMTEDIIDPVTSGGERYNVSG